MGGVLYWQRNHILERIAKVKLTKIEKSRHVNITFSKMRLDGLDDLYVSDFKIQQPGDTAFLYMGNVHCKLGIWGMMRGDVVLNELDVKHILINAIERNHHRNFEFLFRSDDKSQDDDPKDQKSIYEKFSDMLTKVFDLVPEDLNLQDVRINAIKNNFYASLYLPDFVVDNNEFESDVYLNCKGSKMQNFKVAGNFSNGDRSLECKVYADAHVPVHFPFVDYKYHANINCDTLRFSFKTLDEGSDHIQLGGSFALSNLHVQHARLSDRDLNFGNGSIDYVLNVRDNYVELDSTSTAYFNKLSFHPYVKLDLKPSLKLTVSVNKETFPSDDLFSSIPNGLFMNLDSIKTIGDLDYHFFFQLDTAHIDKLQIQSSLNKHPNFRILSFGKTDFRTINQQFIYNAYDKGKLVRTFFVGPDWENFRPLNQISPYLRAAVLFSEDGRFYTHHGFYDGAFRYSLVQDLKEHRFARGGSTISMQLVKNVFLNKNKNLMRKLEEIMIVWLIENEHLVSKNRMFEIYLNVIEWGPNVYGAEEAAQFYFNKHADQITPSEAIYLATIIPSPKKFMNRFDSNHQLKHYMDFYYKLVGRKMLSSGAINAEEYEGLSRFNVQVTGRASGWLPRPKVVVADTIDDDDEGESLIDLDE